MHQSIEPIMGCKGQKGGYVTRTSCVPTSASWSEPPPTCTLFEAPAHSPSQVNKAPTNLLPFAWAFRSNFFFLLGRRGGTSVGFD